MIDTQQYTVNLVGIETRTAELTIADDSAPTIVVASPPEFGGPGHTWTPEHLFVAAPRA